VTVSRKRRRLDRRRHHQRAQSEHNKALRRDLDEKLTATIDKLGTVESRLADPGVTPDRFAHELVDALVDEFVSVFFALPEAAFDRTMTLSGGIPPERLTSIADELSSRAASNPRLAWIAAGLASAAKAPSRAEEILEAEIVRWEARRQLASEATEPDLKIQHAGDQADQLQQGEEEREEHDDTAPHTALLDPGPLMARLFLERGSAGEALSLLDPRCALDPTNKMLQRARASALHLAFQRSRDDGMQDAACPCESGRKWSECCRERERASLERFENRSPFDELRTALTAFEARRPDLAAFRDEYVDEWISTVRSEARLGEFDSLGKEDDEAWELHDAPVESELETHRDYDHGEFPLRCMAVECSWFSSPDDFEDTDRDSDEDDDSNLVIAQFACDSDVPPPLRTAARGWLDHGSFGLWQVVDPVAEPGVWLVDILTRQRVYASMREDEIARMPRWTVLLGAMFPLDGVWSSGGVYLHLDPTTADRMAHEEIEFSDHVLRSLAKERGLKVPKDSKDSFTRRGLTPPYGVVASFAEDEFSPEAPFRSKVLHGSMSTIVGFYERIQNASPRMTNTDGDPLEIMTATFGLADPMAVFRFLARHPDFESEDEGADIQVEPSTLVWFGREMTPAEAAQSMAEIRAEAAKRGLGPVEEADGPRRWIRGHLKFGEDRITIEVNSRKRLERITTWLHKAGATGDPVVERTFTPELDMALPKGPTVTFPAGSPQAEDAWRQHWLEEEVPALGGATPRDAAATPQGAFLLEALLRRFEHDADLARMDGKQGVDVAWLRSRLDMEALGSQYEL
jgi:Protein of unknown function (DUF2384)